MSQHDLTLTPTPLDLETLINRRSSDVAEHFPRFDQDYGFMPDIPHQYRKKAESTKGKEEKGLESYVVNMGFRNSGPPTKKRKIGPTSNAPEEIVFDEAARQDYLSGFHKRKQQRIKHAQNVAIQREKEEKIRDRAEVRCKE